jgi:hypothetical protein
VKRNEVQRSELHKESEMKIVMEAPRMVEPVKSGMSRKETYVVLLLTALLTAGLILSFVILLVGR